MERWICTMNIEIKRLTIPVLLYYNRNSLGREFKIKRTQKEIVLRLWKYEMAQTRKCVRGITASIAAFQAVDLGSIPGQRKLSKFIFFTNFNYRK